MHRPKALNLVALLVALSLVPIYAPANSQDPGSAPTTQDQRIAAVPLVGRLEVHRGKTARVDNIDVEEGSTILDGQTVETSECTSATVRLFPVGMIAPTIVEVGQIDIASNSKVLINYSAGNIKATIERGCARVKSVTVINSGINTPDGKYLAASGRDSQNQKMAETCHPSDRRETYEPVCIPPIIWVSGGAGAVTAVAVSIGSRGSDPSPDTPSGP